MADPLMMGQMGIALSKGIAGFATSRIESRMERAVQGYRNTLNSLQSGMQHNTSVMNSIAIRNASSALDTDLQVQSMRDKGAREQEAAAAGVAGNSVVLSMRELSVSAARANKTRLDNLKAQLDANSHERKNIEMSRILNKDISVIPRASPAMALMGIGKDMVSIWDSHQTPDDTLSSRMSR